MGTVMPSCRRRHPQATCRVSISHIEVRLVFLRVVPRRIKSRNKSRSKSQSRSTSVVHLIHFSSSARIIVETIQPPRSKRKQTCQKQSVRSIHLFVCNYL